MSQQQRIARNDAATYELVNGIWRDWRRYLEIQLELLDLRQAQYRLGQDAAFERDTETPAERTAALQRQLATIMPEQRTTFDAVRDATIQKIQAEAEATARARVTGNGMRPVTIDPDAISRLALHELLDLADGKAGVVENPGWGQVPLRSDDWREVDVAALQGLANEAVYSLKDTAAADRRKRLLAAVVYLLVAIIALAWWALWPRGNTSSQLAANVVPLVNDQAFTPWPLQTLQLEGDNQKPVVLPITATTQPAWPTLDSDAAPQAYWRTPAMLPLQLCLPPALVQEARRVRLHSVGRFPSRSYRLSPTPLAVPDLLLYACGDSSTPQAYGAWESSDLPARQPLQTPVPLGTNNGVLSVQAVRVVGSGQDPLLPPDQARVEIMVSTTVTLDWPSLAPTLLLENGTEGTLRDVPSSAGDVVLGYSIPLPTRPGAAEWSIMLPDTTTRRWQLPLEPPPGRASVLANALRIVTVLARDLGSEPVTLVELEVLNSTAEPLQLTEADLVLERDGQILPLPASAALRAPLHPSETRSITLRVPRGTPGQATTLTLGRARFRLP